jgi:murein DD-endopeptidase MepM/ murein hydrolase activator NlpD/LysM repeat protein
MICVRVLGLVLICGVAIVIGLGVRAEVRGAPGQQIIIVAPENVSTPTPTPVASSPLVLGPAAAAGTISPGSLPALAQIIPLTERGTVTYTIRSGDTLWGVALEMGLDVADVPCAVRPNFHPSDPLVIGDVLEAPAVHEHCHEVQAGETLASIASLYRTAPEQVVDVAWNQLATVAYDKPMIAGVYLRIPMSLVQGGDGSFLEYMLEQPITVSPASTFARGGVRTTQVGPSAVPNDWPYGSGDFAWPVYGWLSQGYRGDHRAIDVAAPTGTFVTAADRGVVVRAGWNDQGYGNFVVIDHNIDYVTLYAHLAEVFVKESDVVRQGQVIGSVGSSGNSTGPHLHFEIRDFGRRINPLEMLMR